MQLPVQDTGAAWRVHLLGRIPFSQWSCLLWVYSNAIRQDE
jgi:hypothetical protein